MDLKHKLLNWLLRKCTRVEVIDDVVGRRLVRQGPDVYMEAQLQDKERTLKIFVSDSFARPTHEETMRRMRIASLLLNFRVKI